MFIFKQTFPFLPTRPLPPLRKHINFQGHIDIFHADPLLCVWLNMATGDICMHMVFIVWRFWVFTLATSQEWRYAHAWLALTVQKMTMTMAEEHNGNTCVSYMYVMDQYFSSSYSNRLRPSLPNGNYSFENNCESLWKTHFITIVSFGTEAWKLTLQPNYELDWGRSFTKFSFAILSKSI